MARAVGDNLDTRADTEGAFNPLAGVGPAQAADVAALEDGQLVERIREGSQDALDALYERYQGTVFAVAQKMLQREADAEEIVLETFWHVWRTPEKYDAQRGTVATYLVLLTRSRALDKLRSRKSGKQPAALVGDMEQDAKPGNGEAAASPNELVDLQEQRERVCEALRQLSDVQRQALELAFFEPLTHEQIAQRLGTPLGTVKTRIRQGLICLRDHLRTSADNDL